MVSHNAVSRLCDLQINTSTAGIVSFWERFVVSCKYAANIPGPLKEVSITLLSASIICAVFKLIAAYSFLSDELHAVISITFVKITNSGKRVLKFKERPIPDFLFNTGYLKK